MKREDLWDALWGKEQKTVSEELESLPYDEMFEVNLGDGRYRILKHVDDKYLGNTLEGDYARLSSYAIERFVHPQEASRYARFVDLATMRERLGEKGLIRGEFRFRATDGSWVETVQLFIAGEVLGLEGEILRSYVFDKRRLELNGPSFSQERKMRREEVTGLLEGLDFFRDVQKRMGEFDVRWCVINIIIEQFKLFTDWFGLDRGRFLITQIAQALSEASGQLGGYVGYLGQDEFVLVVPYEADPVSEIFLKLQSITKKASNIDGFSPSFGISFLEGREIMVCFNEAGLALEENRGNRHHRIYFYDREAHQKVSREYKLIYDFKKALNEGEICFYLQPQCTLPSRCVVGAESLARWKKDGEWISPAVFVPALEKHGLISQLDRFIWESVCQWLRSWLDRGREPVPISVNVSRLDLFNLDVPKVLTGLVSLYKLDPKWLKVEITESAYSDDGKMVAQAVSRLQEAGFMVFMDDFGSGYSSLNMLQSVNVDVIKLDAKFLQMEQEKEHKGVNILESILHMTRALGTPVIVEGVETLSQVTLVTDLGCEYMQGFYFYRPMPVQDFEALIEEPSHVDSDGFVFKGTSQVRVREFLDENIYSDAMLNNILGPVCFYLWHGEDVDIIRYNQPYYEMVGITSGEFSFRRKAIQNYIYPADRQVLYDLLETAENQVAAGAKGVLRVYRPNHVLVWISLRAYFIGEDAQGKTFYTAAQDITESQFVNADLPGGYFRTSLEKDFEFLYISKNFLTMTGFSEEEINFRFGGSLLSMVHPGDREKLKEETRHLSRGEIKTLPPYRLMREKGDYLYVIEQARMTDFYGAPCWQCVALDVTGVMRVRNQMKLLSRFVNDSILFLHSRGEQKIFEVVVHGLADYLGLSDRDFEKALNSGEFCSWVEGNVDLPPEEFCALFLAAIQERQREFVVHVPGKGALPLLARANRVNDGTDLAYIVVMSVTPGDTPFGEDGEELPGK